MEMGAVEETQGREVTVRRERRCAIREGCGTLNEIAGRTGAGSNCGSCRPLIARMVEEEALASRV